jgi:hypothetical protein
MSFEYKIDDIKKLLSKIENLKERKHIEKIREIIFKENPDLSITKKSSGTLLFFHNLSQSTYKRIDNFFNKIENDKINTLTTSLSESYDKTLSDMNIDTEPKIKLSNAEKKIIKKKEYHKQISQDNDDVYISDDDIFLGKN